MITYQGLHKMLKDRNETLRGQNGIGSILGFQRNTCTSLRQGRYVSLDTIDKLCEHFDCQPGDLLEYHSNESERKAIEDRINHLETEIIRLKEKLNNVEE